MEKYNANPGKKLIRAINGIDYLRIPIKTHLITKDDDMADVVKMYPKSQMKAGDILFISEKAVACTQSRAIPMADVVKMYPKSQMKAGDILFISEKAVACTQSRAIPMADIHPRKLAVFLSRHVTKTPVGIGLGIPETMEMALQECGTPRILFAAFCAVIGKIFGKRGWFYIVAGPKARGIDGPCDCTIPPYDNYVVLIPDDPMGTSKRLAQALGYPVAIVDINDLGANILGFSEAQPSLEWLAEALGDNPLGQSRECTPMGILRKA